MPISDNYAHNCGATVLIAWSGGLFDVNSKRLEIKRHDLSIEVGEFQKQRQALISQNRALETENERLRLTAAQIAGENRKVALINKEEVLRSGRLQQEVKITELKSSIAALSSASADLSPNDPTLQRICEIIEAAGRTSPEVKYAASVVSSNSVGAPLAAALCLPLLKVTKDNAWKQAMITYSIREMNDSIRAIIGSSGYILPLSRIDWSRSGIYLSLLRNTATLEEKINVLRSLHETLSGIPRQKLDFFVGKRHEVVKRSFYLGHRRVPVIPNFGLSVLAKVLRDMVHPMVLHHYFAYRG
jgi:hypothetical protein